MRIWVIEPERASVSTVLENQIARMVFEMGMSPSAGSHDRIRGERRLYPRVPCSLLVDFATQGCAYRDLIRNISAEGAFIESHRPVPPGPDISLVISFPHDRHPLKIDGHIVRVGGQGLGVRFDPAEPFVIQELPP